MALPRFGTDGVRGVANSQLTVEFALRIGRATARVLGGPRVVVGRDPRWSGEMLEAAFVAGVCAEGVDVELLGVVPTPAVAFRSQSTGVPAAMISASHNVFSDNGIKVFAAGGLKLTDAQQHELEAELDVIRQSEIDELQGSETGEGRPTGTQIGRVSAFDVTADYLDMLVGGVDRTALAGSSVVVDCANGASSALARAAFESIGATVQVLSADPDGANINESCGSTHPDALADAVRTSGADFGFAFDGDADRMLAVDAGGRLIDGDQLIAINALHLQRSGKLVDNTVVVTVMTNLGFRLAMAERGVTVIDTAVGDRFVLEALDRGGYTLGGEQSGHIIFRDRATTGDGLLSAIVTACVVAGRGLPLATLADEAMTRLPQVLRNVGIAAPMPDVAERLAGLLEEASADLGDNGRVLVRPSGTEPLVRVMVEAVELAQAESWALRLATAVENL